MVFTEGIGLTKAMVVLQGGCRVTVKNYQDKTFRRYGLKIFNRFWKNWLTIDFTALFSSQTFGLFNENILLKKLSNSNLNLSWFCTMQAYLGTLNTRKNSDQLFRSRQII